MNQADLIVIARAAKLLGMDLVTMVRAYCCKQGIAFDSQVRQAVKLINAI